MWRMTIAGLWLLFGGNVQAAWQLESFTDRMTDQVIPFAFVDAKEPSNGVGAYLNVRCMRGSKGLERIFPTGLTLWAHISRTPPPDGEILSWRIDDGPVKKWNLLRASDGKPSKKASGDSFNLGAAAVLRGARRFRLQALHSDGSALFYEFDIAGVNDILGKIPCRNND